MVSSREEIMLGVIWRRWEVGQKTPMRELRDACGYSQKSAPGPVSWHLRKLCDQGFVEKLPMAKQSMFGRSLHFYTRGPRLAGIDSKGRPMRVIDETRGWT